MLMELQPRRAAPKQQDKLTQLLDVMRQARTAPDLTPSPHVVRLVLAAAGARDIVRNEPGPLAGPPDPVILRDVLRVLPPVSSPGRLPRYRPIRPPNPIPLIEPPAQATPGSEAPQSVPELPSLRHRLEDTAARLAEVEAEYQRLRRLAVDLAREAEEDLLSRRGMRPAGTTPQAPNPPDSTARPSALPLGAPGKSAETVSDDVPPGVDTSEPIPAKPPRRPFWADWLDRGKGERIYEGMVQIDIAPPAPPNQVKALEAYIRGLPQASIRLMWGKPGKGSVILLELRQPLPLRQLLAGNHAVTDARNAGRKSGVSRLRVWLNG